MSKRRADKQLTDRNWDEEEDDHAEEPKAFEKASDEVLATRVIRKVKRRIPEEPEKKVNAFASFSFSQNGNAPSTKSTVANSTLKSMNTTTTTTNATNGNKTSDEYLSKVAKLNQGILGCISKKLDEQVHLNLTPCFEDYIKHFQRITKEEEDRQQKNNNGNSSPAVAPAKVESQVPKQTFTFGNASPAFEKSENTGGSATFKFDSKTTTPPSTVADKAETKSVAFSFGLPAQSATTTPASGFTFGKLPIADGDKDKPSGFTGFGTPFATPTSTFAFGVSSASSTPAAAQDEEDQPPKVDVKPVEEEGSLYMKKVKLFYKKEKAEDGNAYAEKGIGFLHIKKLEDNVHQLLIRAQTTVGNVLLNVRLKNLPLNRIGKNNVALACVPNPPIDPKSTGNTAVMFLIRVKNSEEADELLKRLQEFQDEA